MSASYILMKMLRDRDNQILLLRTSGVSRPSSGFNDELLAEAIADAKAVRATAFMNAKIAMEEAFNGITRHP